MASKPVFISHAVLNKGLADKLVDLIETGIGISASDIFCSSLEGLGIDSGTNFIDFIHKQISKPKVVILLLTPEYFNSNFCLCELGASWILSHRIIPLLVSPLEYSDVKAVLTGIQLLNIDRKSDLNQMLDELTSVLQKEGKPFARWEVKRDKFLEEMSGYLATYKPSKKISQNEFENIKKKYNEAVEEIKLMQKEIEKKNDLIEKLKRAKDSNAVKQIVFENVKFEDYFDELLEKGQKSIMNLSYIVKEALYYHYRGERLPIPRFGEDDIRDQIKYAIELDFLKEYEDGIDLVYDDPKISNAITALDEIQQFLSKVEEDGELEKDGKEFLEYYVDRYQHKPTLASRRFWQTHFN